MRTKTMEITDRKMKTQMMAIKNAELSILSKMRDFLHYMIDKNNGEYNFDYALNLQTIRYDLPTSVIKIKTNSKGFLVAVGDDFMEYEESEWSKEGLIKIYEQVCFEETCDQHGIEFAL